MKGQSLIQRTFDRINDLVPAKNILVATNQKYEGLVLEQIPQMSKEQLLLERRQRLQGKIQRVSDRPLPKSQSGTNPSYTQSYLSQ